ncbi:nitroreductase/quinone reductase family protein [Mycolicibacterium hodleri]|uniref:Nitroreductase family deazaflavin-dependent oxidoreductase n=1 Tax=Mycolicibacterium hodleri TaxID=49897 RepID=A0A502DLR4_9MYCO|nr:nitroreductase/quinone reductase family protein [Mycolicibacterium hodleri]TPG25600.1 nitroreductase family deazaflavin-dependent oxidoreductase [Mycolicibacterium hodleri]
MADTPDTSFNSAIIEEFRANDGKVGGQFQGANLLLLHTTRAKFGAQRVNPVMYFRIDDKLAVFGSYAGADVDPAWAHNLCANPREHIEIGTDAYDEQAREMPPVERDAASRRIVETAPGFGDYEQKTDRVIPVFELQKI